MASATRTLSTDIHALGAVPELGAVPSRMLAQTIRAGRPGASGDAVRLEAVAVPGLGPRDVLVYVMAAGAHDDTAWAAGCAASGVVWSVGLEVTLVAVGDEVVVHGGMWSLAAPRDAAGTDSMLAPGEEIRGPEVTRGSVAQYARVQDRQCLPKPPHLTWEQAAAYPMVAATAYRMLHGWPPHVVAPGDPVLVWDGAGGLGAMAIQIVRAAGARPVAAVTGADQGERCKRLGAVGVIDRRLFTHWGELPSWSADAAYHRWLQGARAFGSAFWNALGDKQNPAIVFEHPGEATLPTSCFVCETGGMVVICAGTTGHNASLDLRYHWMRQKRLQGSHGADDNQARAANDLVTARKVDPCLSRVFGFAETAACHQWLRNDMKAGGTLAILVNAPHPGLRTLGEVRAALTR